MNFDLGIYDLTDCSTLGFKDRLLIYKKAGFEEIGLYLDQNYMQKGENYVEIINYAREMDLKIKQVHIDYKISNLICDKETDEYFEYLEEKAKECKFFGIPYLVLHASKGDIPPVVDDMQLKKLTNVTKRYPEVTFCFENVRNNANLEKILNLKQKNIKMCYDLGHAHAYGNERELFEKFKKYIICSHLHNNYGKDDHNTLKDGEIDYMPILKELTKIKNSSNCLEMFPKRGEPLSKKDFEKFVKSCLDI